MSFRSSTSSSDRRPGAYGGLLWIAASCLASLLLYITLFGAVLDRPLTLGMLHQALEARLARAAAIREPKLVILAGSNGPYSHRCETMEPILHMPCINGGVAVGVGLDYLFARWKPLLHAADTVYLPMEEAQYVRSRVATMVGPDAAIMLRYDRATLLKLPPDRWAGALFAFGLRDAVMAPIEMALVAAHFHDPRPAVEGSSNVWGDHVGHTAALGRANQAALTADRPWHATAGEIRTGYGTRLISRFIAWARAHRVHVVGGLPTEFADSPMPDATLAAIRDTYRSRGAVFLELPDHSEYPRSAFFDSPDHLNEQWQIIHSVAVAEALARRWRTAAR